MIRIVLLVLAFSCAKPGISPPPFPELQTKYDTYKSLAPSGWIHTDKCDALLWSALLAVSKGEAIDITAARNEDGQWFRRPAKDCFATGGSKSTISRDMLTGLMIYALHFKDEDVINKLWDYGAARAWRMGDGDPSRTIMSPGLVGMLADIREHVTGKKSFLSTVPQVYSTEPGYTTHLSLLGLYIRGKVGKFGISETNAIKDIVAKNPNNPLALAIHAKYIDGNFTASADVLMRDWPEGRLPTTSDWCEEWRTQRAEDDVGMMPCSPEHTHSGGSFMFAAAIVLDLI
jgi:hypothetical protein